MKEIISQKKQPCCCNAKAPEKQSTSQNIISCNSEWSWKDRWGQIKCRISSRRDDYRVNPGLYALGEPNKNSDVFVTANYKLTFDILRKDLKGMNAWILILNTKGINVWCAAGKGTFETKELITKIREIDLENIVTHKRIIVPQLGAAGVSAHKVTEATGFKVVYGPIRSEDAKDYIENNYKATEEMRLVQFPLRERLMLVPIEFYHIWKLFLFFSALILLFFSIRSNGIIFENILMEGLPIVVITALSIVTGILLLPAFLPILPSRSFAIKGFIAGLVTPISALFFIGQFPILGNIYIILLCWTLFPMLSSYIGLQFTGSSTFTSKSGVKKELKIGLPIYITTTILSVILLVSFKISTWGPS